MNSQVGGQRGIQRADELFVRVRPVEVARGNLSRRVNARIRPSGHEDRASRPSQFAQGFFELTLHRALVRLPLASEKVRAVVGKSQLVTCHVQWSVISIQPISY